MDSGIVGKVLQGSSTVQNNHVIWGSIRRSADETASCDFPSRNDWSGSFLENVAYKDLSTSGDTFSGLNSSSHEPDINPGTKAGEGLPDKLNQKAAVEQEFLLKHGVWSVGSQGHVDGLCKPCHFVHTPKGCKSGFNCTFCHLPHVQTSSQTGNRPSREKRDKCKELLNSLYGSYEGRLGEASDLLKQVTSQSLYMQRVMTHSDTNEPEQGRGPAVKEAHDPADERVTPQMLRAEAARNLVKDLRCTPTAEPSAAAAPANNGTGRPGGARKREPNLVSL